MATDLRNGSDDLSQRMLNVEKDRWHSLECLESGSVLYEGKDGAYRALEEDLFSGTSTMMLLCGVP
ncbi:MAG: hypothetical protein IKX20_08810 [Paludibacteraceae bacterium]|nr:hypothetical protein [Paludibacteraceae bacterium]